MTRLWGGPTSPSGWIGAFKYILSDRDRTMTIGSAVTSALAVSSCSWSIPLCALLPRCGSFAIGIVENDKRIEYYANYVEAKPNENSPVLQLLANYFPVMFSFGLPMRAVETLEVGSYSRERISGVNFHRLSVMNCPDRVMFTADYLAPADGLPYFSEEGVTGLRNVVYRYLSSTQSLTCRPGVDGVKVAREGVDVKPSGTGGCHMFYAFRSVAGNAPTVGSYIVRQTELLGGTSVTSMTIENNTIKSLDY